MFSISQLASSDKVFLILQSQILKKEKKKKSKKKKNNNIKNLFKSTISHTSAINEIMSEF